MGVEGRRVGERDRVRGRVRRGELEKGSGVERKTGEGKGEKKRQRERERKGESGRKEFVSCHIHSWFN